MLQVIFGRQTRSIAQNQRSIIQKLNDRKRERERRYLKNMLHSHVRAVIYL